jgi:hypothetical protein
MRYAEGSAGIELMKDAEKEFGRQALGLRFQIGEVGLVFFFKVVVIELVRLHHMTINVDDFGAVEHLRLP